MFKKIPFITVFGGLVASLLPVWFFVESHTFHFLYVLSACTYLCCIGMFLVYRLLKQNRDKLVSQLQKERNDLKSETELNKIVSKITNDVIWDCDLQTEKISYNTNYHSLFGYVDSEPGSWQNHLFKDDKQRVLDKIQRFIAGNEQIWSDEYRFVRKDGSISEIFDRGYIFRDDSGKAYRMVGCMMDITVHKENEKKIQRTENIYSTIFKADLIGLSFSKDDGTILEANDAFLSMIGYTRADLETGALTWKVISKIGYVERDQAALTELCVTGTCLPYEKEYIKKDGSSIWVLVGSSQLDNDLANQVTYVINITNNKKAEETEAELQRILIKQQEEFKNIFMNAPAFISIRRGPELKLEFANKALTDFSNRITLGSTPQESVDKFKANLGPEVLLNVYKSGKSYQGKSFHLKMDRYNTGELNDCWFDFVLEPVFNSEGEVDGVASFSFDVTDMVLATKKVEENEKLFRFLADAIPHKIWTAGPDGIANYYNKGWYDYLGAQQEEDIRSKLWSIIHPDEADLAKISWEKCVSSGTCLESEHRLMNTNGNYEWHLSRAIPHRDENGAVKLWVGSSTNINEQKLYAEAIKLSEEHFRGLANQNSVMIWQVNTNRTCTYVNNTWTEQTGLSFEESLGTGWIKAVHPEDRQQAYEIFTDAFNDRLSFTNKYRLKLKTGDYRWVLNYGNPIHNPHFSGYVGSITDIHNQEVAQNAVKMLMDQKDEFLTIASHELKTPITSIKGALQIVERLTNDKEEVVLVNSYIKKANKQVNKLTGLIENLLDVTKINAGKLSLNTSTFIINELIKDCIDAIQMNTINQSIIYQDYSDVMVTADKYRVEQVITNYITNAIKYSPDKGEITVFSSVINNAVKVTVKDSGIGIPEGKMEKVFDRFFRVQDNSANFSGLGLGLYISSEIINQHGGNVGVLSTEGIGSEFWFSLPLN